MTNTTDPESSNQTSSGRTESDRLLKRGRLKTLVQRPEIGPFGVLILLILALGFFSIPAGVDTWNPFAGEGFNALGIRNNTRLIAQLGIIALGAGLLIVAGEFDLSIGSMIGFAGMCMGVMLKWGFHVNLPWWVNTPEGLTFGWVQVLSIPTVDPWLAVCLTLCFTLFFGWLIGFIVVRTGLASFIVSLSFLFFLRGLTEVSYRAFNKAPNQSAGSTQVSDLPDIKNIIHLPERGEIELSKAKKLPHEDLMSVYDTMTPDQIVSLTEKITFNNIRFAETKTQINETKALESFARDLKFAEQSGNTTLQETLKTRIETLDIPPVAPKTVTDADIARAHLESFPTVNPLADFFGGDILERLFDWLYVIGWNVNNYGNQFAPGLYSAVMIWLIIAAAAYLVLSRTQAGNWIYSTGGNLEAAKANGVPTGKVKISLFMFSAFCATIFAACQVFETNAADAAKGNLKELEAIAAAVIGGVGLTGGFGTVFGIVLGAAIFGIAREAFFYIPFVDGSFYRVFLGLVLLTAALANENIRNRITGGFSQ